MMNKNYIFLLISILVLLTFSVLAKPSVKHSFRILSPLSDTLVIYDTIYEYDTVYRPALLKRIRTNKSVISQDSHITCILDKNRNITNKLPKENPFYFSISLEVGKAFGFHELKVDQVVNKRDSRVFKGGLSDMKGDKFEILYGISNFTHELQIGVGYYNMYYNNDYSAFYDSINLSPKSNVISKSTLKFISFPVKYTYWLRGDIIDLGIGAGVSLMIPQESDINALFYTDGLLMTDQGEYLSSKPILSVVCDMKIAFRINQYMQIYANPSLNKYMGNIYDNTVLFKSKPLNLLFNLGVKFDLL
ncbi:MAG: hypothetical protein ACEPOV_03950 [Hyphomicrobiales bacterium]